MNLTAGILAIGVAAAAAGRLRHRRPLDLRGRGRDPPEGTRVRWSAGQQAAEQACETSGGVYVGGGDTCEFGVPGAGAEGAA